MENKVRTPVQTRSIETKKKIINSSFELFSKFGYYETNTAEIAKNANVSTGIVYGYFKNKKDMLIEVTDIYKEKVTEPILEIINNLKPNFSLEDFLTNMLNAVIKIHKNNTHIHEALHSIAHTDKQINEKFIQIEDEISLRIKNKFDELKFSTTNCSEKIHLAMNLIQSFSHEYIYDQHKYLDYEEMRKIVVQQIIDMFK